jgi:MFS family permease
MTISKPYYGWFVLAASAVSELLMQGATSYSAGLFVLPLQGEFHISRANANSSVLILFLGGALMAPLVGKSLDRFSLRRVMAAGALAFGAGLAGIALTSSLWVMALMLLIPIALGFDAAGPLNTTTVAARWFHRRRGLALGLAAVATSGGGLIVPLLARAIQDHGWRAALIGEGVLIAGVIVLFALLVVRDSPRAMGLESHPENRGRDAPATARPGWRQILSRRSFWIPSLVLVSITSTSQAILISVVPWGVQMGVTMARAAFFVTAFALCAAVTKVLAGILADRIDQRLLLWVASLLIAAAHLLLFLAPGHGALLAASCLAGVALGCAMPSAAGLIAHGFGAEAFGAAMGWTYALSGILTIVTVRFIGTVFDRTHSYGPAFGAFLAMVLAIFAAALLLPPQAPARMTMRT